MPEMSVYQKDRRSVRAGPAKRSQPHRILCVDDDDDLTRVIKARMYAFQVEVTRARNGKEGLKAAYSHRPNAIITDLGMPNGDGEYLIQHLKSRPSTAPIPVVVISGIDDESRKAQIHRLGANAILQKPFKFAELFSLLMSQLEFVGNQAADCLDVSPQTKIVDELDSQFARVDGNNIRLDITNDGPRSHLFLRR